MTGPEIVPTASKAAAAAKEALSEDDSVKAELLEAARDSPHMRAAADSYARRIALKQEILLRLFLPLALLVGVSRDYFDRDFAADLAEKIADTHEEHLTSPPPSVAVPAMQGLSYSLDEPDLKEMYLNLLATAADDRVSESAHPSFADIIKQLSPAEARELLDVLQVPVMPIVRLRLMAQSGPGGTLMCNHVLPYSSEPGGPPGEEPSLPVWVDNWVRLGLIDVDYGAHLTADGMYDFVRERPEYMRLVAMDERGEGAIDVDQGLLRPTDFGRRFRAAVSPTVPPREAS